MKRIVAILVLLCLCRLSPLKAQDTALVAFPIGEPVLVWQNPLPATMTGLAVLVGASPMFSETMHTQNLLIREEVQMWRRNSFDFRQLHFDNVLQMLPLVSVVGLSLAGVPSRHEGWPLFFRAAGCAIISTAIVQPLKGVVDELRPDRSAMTSFPSGHTSFAFSGAELLRLEYGQTSAWIPAAGFAVAVLTGFMRIYNDRHWAGDVLAGAGIGILSADLSYWLNGLIERKLWNR